MKGTKRGPVLTALLLAALLTACAGQAPAAPAKSLYQQGQEVAALMGEMAGSSIYTGLYTSEPEMLELLADAGAGDFSAPKAVYSIRVPGDALMKVADAMGIAEAGGLSDGLRAAMNARVLSALPTQINAMGGSEVLAASSICSAGKCFVSSEPAGNVIYLYTYEDAVPAAVVFVDGEDGAVSASGTLLLNDSFGRYSLEELRGVLEQLGAEVAEVTPS